MSKRHEYSETEWGFPEVWNAYECFGYNGKEMIEIIIGAFEEAGIRGIPPAEKLWEEWSSMIFFLFDWAMLKLGKWEKSMFSEFTTKGEDEKCI